MASHSEISLVDPTKLEATPVPKTGKKRARGALSRKAEKRSNARKNSKQAAKTQSCDNDVVPVMKLRAVDIVDDGDTLASRLSKAGQTTTGTAGDVDPRIVQMPASRTTETNPDPDLGPAIPTGDDGEPLVTDPELLELLEQLSTTIDTAHTVLDAATGAPAQQESAESTPKPEPTPQPEPESDDPPPLAAEFAAYSAPEPPGGRKSWGFGLVVNAAIAGLILAAGTAWLTYTNPWLLEGGPAAPVEPEQTASAPAVTNQPEAAATPAEQVVKSVAVAPSAAPAPFTPPDEDPVPMESTTPQAPLQTAATSSEIRVAAGQSVPLSIALPATPDQREISVMIQDVPENAKLSAGKSLGAGNWLLNETELNSLTLNTAERIAPGKYQLEVIFVRSDGKVPETRKLALSVQAPASEASASATGIKLTPETAGPGSAGMSIAKTGIAVELPVAPREPIAPKPEQQQIVVETPKLPQLSKSEIKTILTRGGALLSEGDISGARLLLQYAAERGSKTAMVKLGESYDPKYLEKLGAKGVQPDNEKAALWYNRASAAQ